MYIYVYICCILLTMNIHVYPKKICKDHFNKGYFCSNHKRIIKLN